MQVSCLLEVESIFCAVLSAFAVPASDFWPGSCFNTPLLSSLAVWELSLGVPSGFPKFASCIKKFNGSITASGSVSALYERNRRRALSSGCETSLNVEWGSENSDPAGVSDLSNFKLRKSGQNFSDAMYVKFFKFSSDSTYAPCSFSSLYSRWSLSMKSK